MRKIITLLLLLISVNIYSQQDIALCEDGETQFNYITSSGQAGSYSWSIDGDAITDNDSSITVDWSNYSIGNHVIQVGFTSLTGCNSPVVSYTVNLIECPTSTMYAPNAFTPNDDGTNNIWIPIGYNYKNLEFLVFDRWGEKLFESQGGVFGWDGTYKGSECQQDVYVYVIKWTDANNQIRVQYGHITLLR